TEQSAGVLRLPEEGYDNLGPYGAELPPPPAGGHADPCAGVRQHGGYLDGQAGRRSARRPETHAAQSGQRLQRLRVLSCVLSRRQTRRLQRARRFQGQRLPYLRPRVALGDTETVDARG